MQVMVFQSDNRANDNDTGANDRSPAPKRGSTLCAKGREKPASMGMKKSADGLNNKTTWHWKN